MDAQSELTLLERAAGKFGDLNFAEKKLFTLAQEWFEELSNSEYELFRAISNGEPIDYRTGNDANDKPENAANWGAERTLRGNRIRWLCIEPEIWKLCLPQGIDISGAKIEGSWNLSFSEVQIPLRFLGCYFAEMIRLQQTRLRRLDLCNTHIASTKVSLFPDDPQTPTSVDAREVNVTGSIFLREFFQANGRIHLYGAKIGGNLACYKCALINEGGDALNAERVRVEGYILLDNNFYAKGRVNLLGAMIGRSLVCNEGKFINENGDALDAANINVKGDVSLSNGFLAIGRVSRAISF